MSKLQKLLKATKLILQNPALLNKVLDAPEVKQNEVKQKYGMTEGLKTIQISDLLPNLNDTIEPFSFLDGGSTPLDLLLLKTLAKRYKECEYFEIGTWRGESVANVASVAKHCTTLNLPDTDMLAMGLDKNYVQSHRFFSKQLSNTTHLQGNSLSYDYTTLNKKFDLVFIDGDHHYDSVVQDTKTAFELLKNENAVIVWHDYGNSPESVRWNVLHAILEGTPEHLRKHLYCVSNTLCAIYFKDAPSSQKRVYPKVPETWFSVDLKKHSG